MTSSYQWKNTEKKTAEDLATERTPFSGSTSGLTSSDTLHPNLFVEIKTKKKHAVKTLYNKTRELAKDEGKVPLVVLRETDSKEMLWVFERDHIFDILQEIDLHRIQESIPKGTTIRKLLETQGENVRGLYEIQRDIDAQIEEIVMAKKLTKDNKQLLKGLAVLSHYIESIRDFQKSEEENINGSA